MISAKKLDLEKISVLEIDKRLVELSKKIREMREFVEEEKSLKDLKEAIFLLLEFKAKANSSIGTEQGRRIYRVLSNYPLLAMSKKWQGVSRLVSAYQADKELEFYANEAEEWLKASAWGRKMAVALAPFLKEEKIDSIQNKEVSRVTA
ncbi:MAG: hypothetical protein Q8O30_06475 [Candidatus Omnitrophota bacterium]|nr:hypothetical protein [Candidatus Omnitrophota bacterium]